MTSPIVQWHYYPFVRLVIPLILGILCCEYKLFFLNEQMQYILVGVALFQLIMLAIHKNETPILHYFHGLSIQAVFLLIGYIVTFHNNELNHVGHFSKQTNTKLQFAQIHTILPETKHYHRAIARVFQQGNTADSLQKVNGNILINYSKDSFPHFFPQFTTIGLNRTNFYKISPPKNPHQFNYQQFLHYKYNTHFQVYLKNSKQFSTIKPQVFHNLLIYIELWRKQLSQHIKRYVPDFTSQAILLALTIGDRSEIDEATEVLYQSTGAMHVLAVSGLHVGIIALLVNAFLRLFIHIPLWRVWKTIVLILSLWLFVMLTGAGASVCRAAFMLSFVIIGQLLQRDVSTLNSIAASAFCLLIYNPFLLFQVGFQFSYLAVLGIIFFYPQIYPHFVQNNRFLDYVWKLIVVSISAQLALFPLSIYYFGQFSLLFWLSSLVVIPTTTIILFLGLMLITIGFIHNSMALFLGMLISSIIEVVHQLLTMIKAIPYQLVDNCWLYPSAVLILYGIISLILISLIYKRFSSILFAIALLVTAGIHYSFKIGEQQQQQKLIIYHHYSHLIVDIVDNQQVFNLVEKNTPTKTIDYTTNYFRQQHFIKHISTYHFKDSIPSNQQKWLYRDNQATFNDKTIVFFHNQATYPQTYPQEVDFVVITTTVKYLDLSKLKQLYKFDQLIFPAGHPQKLLTVWKRLCKKAGINYYDIGEKGALIIDLS